MTTTATLEGTDRAARVHNILERSCCLVLTCGHLGNHRRVELRGMKVSKDETDLGTATEEMGASKRLFFPKDLRPCERAISSVKQRLGAMSIDGGTRLFGTGTYMLPLLAVAAAEQVLVEGQAFVAATAEKLVELLPKLILERQIKLKALFNAADYPTADDVRAAYSIGWNWVKFGAPERLEEYSAEAAARATAQWNGMLADAYQDVLVGVRSAALKVMQELADRLRPDEEGKPKALRPTALRDLQELLGNLPVLNSVAEDNDLANVLAGVAASSAGVTLEVLRDAPAVRGMLLAKAEAAIAQLDGLVSAGRRAMNVG